MKTLFSKNSSEFVGQKLTYFLATGNLVSNTGLDLMQVLIIRIRTSLSKKIVFFLITLKLTILLDNWIHDSC